MKRVLNLGAGTQSSVVLLMMERGELPRADVALFADTGWEPREVYEHLEWLKDRTSIPIATVSRGNIYDDAMNSRWQGRRLQRWASMPLYVLTTQRLHTPGETLFGRDDAEYVLDLDRPQQGKIKRQCTSEYKVEPIERYIKTVVLGLADRGRWPTEPEVVQVFGLSGDEMSRVRQPPLWATFEYPLIFDLRWPRWKVIEWAEKHYPDHRFPRSACVGCPYHSNAEWRWIKDNDPEGWAEAIALDRKLRNEGRTRGTVYLHRSCVPLEDANLDERDTNQTYLRDGMANECIGMCGV